MKRIIALAVMAACATAGQALAGGYEVEAQDTTLLGTANAGKATVADSATVLFWNPAGLAFVEDNGLRASLTLLDLEHDFTDAGTTDLLGLPAQGPKTQEGIDPAWVPAIAASWSLGDRWSLGIGLQSQWGLKTNWGTEWVGRYHATRSELFTLNLSPALSWQATDTLSLGIGLGIQYAESSLENQIDFGSIGVATLPPELAAQLGLAPQQNDGAVKVEGDDWAVGYTLGLLWQVGPNTRLGLGYRGEVEHDLGGPATFDVPPEAQIFTLTGQFMDTGSNTELLTPATASLGFQHTFASGLTFLADVTWVDWSAVQVLRATFDNPAQAPIESPQFWDDTYRISAGLTYPVGEHWTLRGGIADAPTPVPDETRNARLADSDRTWYSLGASRQFSDRFSLDLAYIYIDQDDGPIDFNDPLSGTIRGNTTWAVQVFSVGTTVRF